MADRPVLYLLHGLLCDETVWSHQRRALATRYEVRMPRLRGYRSLADMARAVLDGAPQRFVVVGHSMGGRVALEVARLAGTRLDGLGLFDTGVHPAPPGEAATRQVLIDLARSAGMAALARAWAAPMVVPGRLQDRPLMAAIHRMVKRYTLDDYLGQVEALLGRPDATPGLPAIGCRTLVLCGRHDRWSPVEQHRAFAGQLRHATLVVIEEAGHMVTMERPAAVTEALGSWLDHERDWLD